MTQSTPKVTFILIKDKQVETAETIEGHVDAIERRISRIQDEGFDATVAVFGEGAKWDISFPMTSADIAKISVKLHRNL
jgi:hypothetical protein